MKKFANRAVALVLCITVLLSVFSVSTFAIDSYEEWTTYYQNYSQTDGNVLVSPGSDETQRNFSWYSSKKSKGPRVLVSEDENFSECKEFKGTFILTPEGLNVNKATVTGLEIGKRYYYKCLTTKSESKVGTIDTVRGNDFNALYVTDIHVTYNEKWCENPLMEESYNVDRLLTDANSRGKLDLVISAGDQGSYGLRSEYMSVLASPQWADVPFALCAGNHDRKGFDYLFLNNNPNKYDKGSNSLIGADYWYVKGNVLFMVFDSNNYSAKTHYDFAKAAVAANPNVKWRVAVMHQDMYGIMSESRREESVKYMQPIFGPIFDGFGIDLVLLGHTHYYSVSNVIYDEQSVESTAGKTSITDPRGSVYFVSGSINHARVFEEEEKQDAPDVGYCYSSENIVYNYITFTNDSVTVSGYELGADEPFHTLTINKTTNNGGHPVYKDTFKDKLARYWFEFIGFFTEFGVKVGRFFQTIEIVNKQK